jgi:hypothetical protein
MTEYERLESKLREVLISVFSAPKEPQGGIAPPLIASTLDPSAITEAVDLTPRQATLSLSTPAMEVVEVTMPPTVRWRLALLTHRTPHDLVDFQSSSSSLDEDEEFSQFQISQIPLPAATSEWDPVDGTEKWTPVTDWSVDEHTLNPGLVIDAAISRIRKQTSEFEFPSNTATVASSEGMSLASDNSERSPTSAAAEAQRAELLQWAYAGTVEQNEQLAWEDKTIGAPFQHAMNALNGLLSRFLDHLAMASKGIARLELLVATSVALDPMSVSSDHRSPLLRVVTRARPRQDHVGAYVAETPRARLSWSWPP